jgi:hypothetical protein
MPRDGALAAEHVLAGGEVLGCERVARGGVTTIDRMRFAK